MNNWKKAFDYIEWNWLTISRLSTEMKILKIEKFAMDFVSNSRGSKNSSAYRKVLSLLVKWFLIRPCR